MKPCSIAAVTSTRRRASSICSRLKIAGMTFSSRNRLAAQHHTGFPAARLAVLPHRPAVDPHHFDPDRRGMRLLGRRPVGDGGGVEEHEVGVSPGCDRGRARGCPGWRPPGPSSCAPPPRASTTPTLPDVAAEHSGERAVAPRMGAVELAVGAEADERPRHEPLDVALVHAHGDHVLDAGSSSTSPPCAARIASASRSRSRRVCAGRCREAPRSRRRSSRPSRGSGAKNGISSLLRRRQLVDHELRRAQVREIAVRQQRHQGRLPVGVGVEVRRHHRHPRRGPRRVGRGAGPPARAGCAWRA